MSEYDYVINKWDELAIELENEFRNMVDDFCKSLLITHNSMIEFELHELLTDLKSYTGKNGLSTYSKKINYQDCIKGIDAEFGNGTRLLGLIDKIDLLRVLRNKIVHKHSYLNPNKPEQNDIILYLQNNTNASLEPSDSKLHIKISRFAFLDSILSTSTQFFSELIWELDKSNGFNSIRNRLAYIFRVFSSQLIIKNLLVSSNVNSKMVDFELQLDPVKDVVACKILLKPDIENKLKITESTGITEMKQIEKELLEQPEFVFSNLPNLSLCNELVEVEIDFSLK